MYYMEWLQAMGSRRHKPDSWMDSVQRDVASKMAVREAKLKGKQLEVWQGRETDLREVRAETLDDNNAIYCKTSTYLDVCTYNDDKRGLLTMVFGAMLYGLIPFSITTAIISYNIFIDPMAGGLEIESVLTGLVSWSAIVVIAYAFYR